MTNDYSYRAYNQDLREYSLEAVRIALRDGSQPYHLALAELIDNCIWTIYNAGKLAVMEHTDNADALFDELGEVQGAKCWTEVVGQFAFCAMHVDVLERHGDEHAAAYEALRRVGDWNLVPETVLDACIEMAGENDLDPDALEIALYWYCDQCNGGQTCDLYKLRSKLDYSPGPITTADGDCENPMVADYLERLTAAHLGKAVQS